MTDNPDLREGDQGEWVTYLQQVLEHAGHSPGAEDGLFGPATAAAVRAVQQAGGCAADGVVGQQTWTALLAADGTPTAGTAGQAPAADADGTASDEQPTLGLRVTAAELGSCEVPEMEPEAV